MNKHVSLETAKKLREAGWEKETRWDYIWVDGEYQLGQLAMWCKDNAEHYPSPDIPELLEELPDHTCLEKHRDLYYVKTPKVEDIVRSMPVEALAELWLKLKER